MRKHWEIIATEVWIGRGGDQALAWTRKHWKRKRGDGSEIKVGIRYIKAAGAHIEVTVAVWRRPAATTEQPR